MTLLVTELAAHHDRSDFDCGEPPLNQFLQRLARQQSAREFSKTYVAAHVDESQILGFYVISTGQVDFENWPQYLHLPRYPVPVARIGRLAVDTRSQGLGVGAVLLRHTVGLALRLADSVGLYAVVVDAKSPAVAAFYVRHGFTRFPDRPLMLFLTLNVARKADQVAASSLGAPH